MPATTLLALAILTGAQAASLDAEQIALREDLLARFEEATSQPLPTEGERGICLTGLVRELKDSWQLFEPSDQERMASVLAPWGNGTLSVLGPRAEQEPPPPPPATQDEPCFGRQSSNYLLTDHFSVEWENGVSQSTAEHFAESLEYSWQREVDELGWNRPLGTDTYPMLAYIAHDDGSAGAYTSVDRCDGDYVPYIVAYSGSWYSTSWAEDMAAHEFAHTIQFSTSYALEFWYWEASAIWMEEQVYPTHNTWSYYVDAYNDTPWIGLNASSQRSYDIFYHMYGAAIFNFFLDNWHDGHDTVKGMWDYAETRGGYYSIPVWDNVEGIGLDFEEVFEGFLAANTVMDYDEQSAFSPIDIHQAITSLPASGESGTSDEPESLGQNYIRFDDSLGGGGDLRVTFQGEAGPSEWFAVLVSTQNGAVAETVRLDLDGNHEGEGWIEFQDGDVYLVVAPWDHDAEGPHFNWDSAPSYAYSWQAELGDAGDPEDPEDPNDTGYDKNDDLPATPGDGAGVGMPGCGCASGGQVGSGALLALLGLMGLARRRD